MTVFNDQTPMPFGKHKGIPLGDVPVSYFHWLWNNGVKTETATRPLAVYILDCMEAFKMENPDLIWDPVPGRAAAPAPAEEDPNDDVPF